MSTLRTGMSVSVAVAVFGAAGAWVITSSGVPGAIPVGDRVQAAAEGLRNSHVYIEPGSEDLLPAEQLARIDDAAAAADPQVFVAVWRSGGEAGYYLDSEALSQLGAELGRPGLYTLVSARALGGTDIGIDADYLSVSASFDPDTGDLAAQRAAALLSLISANDGREYRKAGTSGSDYWGGTGGMIAAAAFLGGFAGLGLALVMALSWSGIRRIRRRT